MEVHYGEKGCNAASYLERAAKPAPQSSGSFLISQASRECAALARPLDVSTACIVRVDCLGRSSRLVTAAVTFSSSCPQTHSPKSESLHTEWSFQAQTISLMRAHDMQSSAHQVMPRPPKSGPSILMLLKCKITRPSLKCVPTAAFGLR